MKKQNRRCSRRRVRSTGVLAALSLLASLCLVTSSAAAQEVDEPVEIDVTVEAFATRAGAQGCLDGFSAFVQGDTIGVLPPVIDGLPVQYCVIVTNAGDEFLTDYFVTIPNYYAELDWDVVATDEIDDPRPGHSTLFVSESNRYFGQSTAPLTVEVTTSNPDELITVSAPIQLDRRDVSVSIGEYTVAVGDTVDVVLEIDATEWPAGALTTILSYDETVIEPLADGDDPQCTVILADNLVCERLSLRTFSISVGRSAPEQWDGPAQVVSIPFVAIAPGSSALTFEAPDLFATVPGTVPVLRGQAIDGSVEVTTPRPLWYPDVDGDSFGDSSAEPYAAAVQPLVGYVKDNTDCDDADPMVSPGAIEVLLNDIDENCDGQLTGPGVVVGDVSCDGRVSILDAILISRYEVGIADGLATCAPNASSGMFLPAGDLNGDNVVNLFDAVTLARCIVGLGSEYCPGG